MHLPNVTLRTNARVVRLVTNSTGTAVTSVEVDHGTGGQARYEAGLFAVCAGAINSAVILLQSANDKHPHGLANGSDQVGRNFMYHQADALLALSTLMAPLAAFIPNASQPKIAIPVGIALAWLGYALWIEQRTQAPSPAKREPATTVV